jgi:hypothetical protein
MTSSDMHEEDLLEFTSAKFQALLLYTPQHVQMIPKSVSVGVKNLLKQQLSHIKRTRYYSKMSYTVGQCP